MKARLYYYNRSKSRGKRWMRMKIRNNTSMMSFMRKTIELLSRSKTTDILRGSKFTECD